MEKREILAISGLLFGFGIIMNFYIWFLVALTNPNMTVFVQFNYYGEGLLETVIYFALFPLILYGIFYYLKQYVSIQPNKNVSFGTITLKVTTILMIMIGICLIILAVGGN